MTEKYVEMKRTKSGIKWGVYFKKDVRSATGFRGQTFDREEDANRYSREVQKAYRDYLDKQRENIHIPTQTVDYLINYFYSTNEFQERLRPTSKGVYRLALKTASEIILEDATKPFGSYFFRRIDAKTADRLYIRIKENFSAHRAAMCVKALRRVWYVCARHGLTSFDHNPFRKMGIPQQVARRVRWEPEEIEKFIKTADEMGPKYSACATMFLACYELAQRPVDMRQLKWDNIRDGMVVFTQQKTGKGLALQIGSELLQRLEALPRSNEHNECIINPATMRPFDRRLYNKYTQEIRKQSGLPENLKMGDLRRTAATEMAMDNCTDDQLRAVTGHETRDVLSIYIVTSAEMAKAAQEKRQRRINL